MKRNIFESEDLEMGRPKGSTNKPKVVTDKETDSTVEETQIETIEEKKEVQNEEILKMLKVMQEQISELKTENEKLKEEKIVLEKTQNQNIKSSSSDKVKLVHLLQGGTTLITSVGKAIRFEKVFEERWVKKEDLEDLVFSHKYNKIFQNIGVYICNKEIVNDMMLQKYYDKYNINDSLYKNMLDMPYAEIMNKLTNLHEDLAYAFKMYVVDQHNEEGIGIKNDVTSAINTFFKTNIFDLFK